REIEGGIGLRSERVRIDGGEHVRPASSVVSVNAPTGACDDARVGAERTRENPTVRRVRRFRVERKAARDVIRRVDVVAEVAVTRADRVADDLDEARRGG